MAEKLEMPRTTYAYKEQTGSFSETEKETIAKYLKVDMTTISWTKPLFQAKTTDERDKTIQQQKEEIIRLQAEVKILKELVANLTQNR